MPNTPPDGPLFDDYYYRCTVSPPIDAEDFAYMVISWTSSRTGDQHTRHIRLQAGDWDQVGTLVGSFAAIYLRYRDRGLDRLFEKYSGGIFRFGVDSMR